jgi:glutathione S-transferase
MKLYFAPGTCSLSPHIVLRELGLPFDLVKVDLGAKKTAEGGDYRMINPKGYVPALLTDEGQVLTEGPALIQYLADRKPEARLAPANGSFARYQLQEWLNFISTEIHKSFSPLFNPAMPDAAKEIYVAKLRQRFAELDVVLAGQHFLTGAQFSVADVYFVYGFALGRALQDRFEPVAGAGRVFCARGCASGSKGSGGGRGSGEKRQLSFWQSSGHFFFFAAASGFGVVSSPKGICSATS